MSVVAAAILASNDLSFGLDGLGDALGSTAITVSVIASGYAIIATIRAQHRDRQMATHYQELIERRTRLQYLSEHPDEATPEDQQLIRPDDRAR